MFATTEDDTLIDIRPNHDQVVFPGFLCATGAVMAYVVNDPDRLLQPMRRTGGPGELEPVIWNGANHRGRQFSTRGVRCTTGYLERTHRRRRPQPILTRARGLVHQVAGLGARWPKAPTKWSSA